jgi:phage tail-like protein
MTTTARPGQSSSYLRWLPAVYQEEAEGGQPSFLGRFLLAFEQLLTGLGDRDEPGLAETLEGIVEVGTGNRLMAGIQRYFDPGQPPFAQKDLQAPAAFLEWLAGWVALTFQADLDEMRRRDFIARVVPLYQFRGTKRGLQELVGIYTQTPVTIEELNTAFQIGVHSTIGVDTGLGGGPPFLFQVRLTLATPDPHLLRRMEEVARAIIDMEKPAHTYYVLDLDTPSMQIGVHSTIGMDTLLAGRTV